MTPLDHLARRIARVEKTVRRLATSPQLGYSSFEGQILEYDSEDNLTQVIGEQYDGTHTVTVVTGPAPPEPTPPLVIEGVGAVRLYWDGTWVRSDDDTTPTVAPMDFARITLHAQPLTSFSGADPTNPAYVVGVISSALGGEITAALPPVEHAFYVVAWSEAGKFSSVSNIALGTPIDPESIKGSTNTISEVPPTPESAADHTEGDAWWVVTETGVKSFWIVVDGQWAEKDIVTVEALNAKNALIEALDVVDLTGTTLTGATIQTRPTSERGVKLGYTNGDEGLFVYADDGTPFLTAVPASGMAVVAGEVKATTLTVTEGTALGGITEVTRSPNGDPGLVRLTAFTTAPKSAPNVTTGYDTLEFIYDSKWGSRTGWSTDGTDWYTLEQGRGPFTRYSESGQLLSNGSATFGAVGHSLVYAEGHVWVLLKADFVGYILRKYTVDGVKVGSDYKWTGNSGDRSAALGYDPATSEFIIAQSTTSNVVRIQRWTIPTSGTNLVAGPFIDTTFNFTGSLATILYGTFDFGVNRYIISNAGNGLFRSVSTTGVEQEDEAWPPGVDGKVGATWVPAGTFGVDSPAQFVSMDSSGVMRRYADIHGFIEAERTKWISNTLVRPDRLVPVATSSGSTGITFAPNLIVAADIGKAISGAGIPPGTTITAVGTTSATLSALATATGAINATVVRDLETDQSPRYKITVPNRSKLHVFASKINTGGTNSPDRMRVYIGEGLLSPSRTAMVRQADPPVGASNVSYSTINRPPSSNNPPELNGFITAGGTVQRLEASSGGFEVDGLSNGSIGVGTFRDSIATLIGTLVQGGRVTVPIAAVDTTYTKAVTFPTPFAAPPSITLSQEGGNPHQADVSYSDVTTTGFNIHVRRSTGTADTVVGWHATKMS